MQDIVSYLYQLNNEICRPARIIIHFLSVFCAVKCCCCLCSTVAGSKHCKGRQTHAMDLAVCLPVCVKIFKVKTQNRSPEADAAHTIVQYSVYHEETLACY